MKKIKQPAEMFPLMIDKDRALILTIMFNMCMGDKPHEFAQAISMAIPTGRHLRSSYEIYSEFLKEFTDKVHAHNMCDDPNCPAH